MTQLYIPTKEKSGDQNRNVTIALRTIERWANSQPAASGGYASLTGPGSTTTPGDLTQAGGFTVNSSTNILLHDTHPASAPGSSPATINLLSDNCRILIQSGGGTAPFTPYISVDTNAGTGVDSLLLHSDGEITLNAIGILGISLQSAVGIALDATTGVGLSTVGSGATITVSTSGIGSVGIANNANDKLGFFNITPAVRQTVTGSRGGNAALASLLTALATNGLIVNSSTP